MLFFWYLQKDCFIDADSPVSVYFDHNTDILKADSFVAKMKYEVSLIQN